MVRPTSIAIFLVSLCGCDSKPANVRSTTPQPAAKASATPANPTPVPSPSVIKNADYPGKGKVTKINLEMASIELDHEEIVGVMAPMRMEFFVTEKKMLDGLQVGDQVDFSLRYKDRAETIVAINKAK